MPRTAWNSNFMKDLVQNKSFSLSIYYVVLEDIVDFIIINSVCNLINCERNFFY